MPQIVAAALAQSAMAAPAIAATTAATAIPAAAAAATPALAQAGSTAAIEAAKQAAIQQGMQQAAQAGIQQAATQAGTQAATQAATQAGVTDVMRQGIAQNVGAPQSGGYGIMSDAPAGVSPDILPARPGMSVAEAQALNAQIAAPQNLGTNPYAAQSSAFGPAPPATAAQPATPLKPAGTPPAQADLAAKSAMPSDAEIASRVAQNFAKSQSDEMNPLEKGFNTALKYAKDNPVQTGLGLMTAGQYMNKPKQPEKKEYKSKVDMSGFQPSIATPQAFERSYEWQGYAVGGPVEQMSAQNAIGDNTMYPQSQYQTPMYSNPMAQRPMPNNVIPQGLDAPVGLYTGEPRMASGGISKSDAREYGLKTRKQRALRGIGESYDEMEKERQKQLTTTEALGKKFDEGIIPRSRKQQLSSPYSAAMDEHARLAKKSKVPIVEMPKTNLGDIDNYMDIPIEAAQGGIMGGLGSYSDGGRLLRGPGDGVSDSIPAVIGKRQPARLADGEFVIPARIVSELGNGSTEAGARKLYAMMERIQNTRRKSIGKKKVAVNSKADKHLPA
jgi:hypothetical protein